MPPISGPPSSPPTMTRVPPGMRQRRTRWNGSFPAVPGRGSGSRRPQVDSFGPGPVSPWATRRRVVAARARGGGVGSAGIGERRLHGGSEGCRRPDQLGRPRLGVAVETGGLLGV
jgi:hypothetical protein